MAQKNPNQLNVDVSLQPDKASIREMNSLLGDLGSKFNKLLNLKPVAKMTELRKTEGHFLAIGKRMRKNETDLINLKKKSRAAANDEARKLEKLAANAVKKNEAMQDLIDKRSDIDSKFPLGDPQRHKKMRDIMKPHIKKMRALNMEETGLIAGIDKSRSEKDANRAKALQKAKELRSQRSDARVVAKELQDKKSGASMSAFDIVAENETRKKNQRDLAARLFRTGAAKSETEALELARDHIKLLPQQTKLGKQYEKLEQRSYKHRKMTYKDEKKMIDEKYKAARQNRLMNPLEAMINKSRETKELRKKTGVGSFGAAGDIAKKGAAGVRGAMGSVMRGPLGAIAGPLLGGALALSIGKLVSLFLKVDEQIKHANKDLYQFQAQGAAAWAVMDKGGTTSIATLTSFRQEMDAIYKETGIKFEDSIKYIGALTQAGIPLKNVLENNHKLFKEVNAMAITSGMSFEQMAGITGQWFTEFRKDTRSVLRTFVQLRGDAARSGMVTQKFYENVMNAAQGVQIYGNNIESVSSAFSGLVKGMKLPQSEAAKLATSLISIPKNMTAAQAAVLASLTDVTDPATKELKSLLMQTNKYTEAQIDAKLARDKLFSGTDIVSNDDILMFGDQTLRDRARELNRALSTAYKDELSRSRELARIMKPDDLIRSMVSGLRNMMPNILGNIDFTDMNAVSKAINGSQVAIENVAQAIGLSEEGVMAIRKQFEKFADNTKNYVSIFQSMTKNDDAAKKELSSAMAGIKAGGSERTKAEKQVQRLLEDAPQSTYDMINNAFGMTLKKNGADAAMNAKLLADNMANTQQSMDEVGDVITKAESAKKQEKVREQASIIEQGTKTISDQIEETIGFWLRKIYDGIMSLFNTMDTFVRKTLYGDSPELEKAFNEAQILSNEARAKRMSLHEKMSPLERLEKKGELTPDQAFELETYRKQSKAYSQEENDVKRIVATTGKQFSKSWFGKQLDNVTGKTDKVVTDAQAALDNHRNNIKTLNAAGADPKKMNESQSAVMARKAEMSAAATEKEKEALMRADRMPTGAFGSGGFTGYGMKDEIAGAVHKGEYVIKKDDVDKIGLSNVVGMLNQATGRVKSSMDVSGRARTLTPMSAMSNQGSGADVSKSSQTNRDDSIIHDNRQFIFHVNQRDMQTIEQIVRKVVYNSKENR